MKFMYLSLIIVFSNVTYSKELVCNLIDSPGASLMKISYSGNTVDGIFLKNLNDKEFRKQDVDIKMLYERDERNFESFTVAPAFESSSINWEQEPECFKMLGTQWFFNFSYDDDEFSVLFAPFYVTESNNCIPPRHIPSSRELNCVTDY